MINNSTHRVSLPDPPRQGSTIIFFSYSRDELIYNNNISCSGPPKEKKKPSIFLFIFLGVSSLRMSRLRVCFRSQEEFDAQVGQIIGVLMP